MRVEDGDVYVAIDGDDVGRRLEQLLSRDKEDEVVAFAVVIDEWIRKCSEYVQERGGNVVFAAGDSVLCRVPAGASQSIYAMTKDVDHDVTFSCGVGNTMSEAMMALKMAKARGRDQLVVWDEVQSKATKP